MNQPQLITSPVKQVTQLRRWVEILLDNSLLLATVILVIIFTIFAGHLNFFSFENLVNILLVATLNGLFACGLTITMLAGNIDFSSTGGTAIASILVGVVFQQRGVPLLPSILIVIGAAVLVGLLTSTLIVNFESQASLRRSPSTALMWPWRWPCAATCKSMWSGSKCSSSGCGVVFWESL